MNDNPKKLTMNALREAVQKQRIYEIALLESLVLQKHYATLLNMHDGGERKTFDSCREWIDRLREVGKIKI